MTPLGSMTGTGSASSRDDRIDFLRGAALLIIFIDHVPKDVFRQFTLRTYAFCDAAEIFFFISGFVAALVYGGAMRKQGTVAAARRVWRRAAVIYGAQLLVLAATVALAWICFSATGNEYFREIFRAHEVFEDPLPYIIPALTLHYQPGYGDILPCYVVLLLAFPLALKGMERNPWLVLAPSFALWLAVQIFDLNLWTVGGEPWYFNPFAWQFLFVLGALFGHPATNGRFAFLDAPAIFWSAVALVAVIFVIDVSAKLNGVLPVVPSLRPDFLPLDKTALAPLRLVSFFALAAVVRRWLPPAGSLTARSWALPIIRCGRSSLQVFTFGAMLASLSVVSLVFSGQSSLVQAAVCIAGVAAQLVFAAWLDARREARTPPTALPPVPLPVRAEFRDGYPAP
jgi:hypothetical protein